jgi:hypothetical protein
MNKETWCGRNWCRWLVLACCKVSIMWIELSFKSNPFWTIFTRGFLQCVTLTGVPGYHFEL